MQLVDQTRVDQLGVNEMGVDQHLRVRYSIWLKL